MNFSLHNEDQFIPLCHEIKNELDPLKSQVETFVSDFSSFKAKKSQFDSLKFDNYIMKEELETEERWMRRIASEALDSEENNLIIVFKGLWFLSTKETNCYDIINQKEVIEIIANSIEININDEFISTAYGIFGNLCQSEELRNLLFTQCNEESIKMILNAKIIIASSILPTKSLQMSLIFLYNFSPHEGASEIMAQNWVIDSLSNVLSDLYNESNIVDIAIKTLLILIDSKRPNILMFLNNDTMVEIYKSLIKLPKTSISINLMLTLKELFPSNDSLPYDENE